MSKQSQQRRTRKLRRNIGALRREHLAIVLFDTQGVTYMSRSGGVIQYRYGSNPKLDFAQVEVLKYQLVEQGFSPLDEEDICSAYIAPSTSLETLIRLFPKTRFTVVPNKENKA